MNNLNDVINREIIVLIPNSSGMNGYQLDPPKYIDLYI